MSAEEFDDETEKIDLQAVVADAMADSLDDPAWRYEPTASDVLDRVALPEHRDALMAWLVDAGVLVQPAHDYYGRTFRACYYPERSGDPAGAAVAKMTVDPDAVPLYRVAEPTEAVDRD